jgi:hypothetical protein
MSINAAHTLRKSLPLARNLFYGRGYVVPNIFLDLIESLRKRSDEERGYDLYLDEVATECLSLKTAWLPSLRNQLDSQNRSAYIDMLASLPSSSHASLRTLDPNFEIFLQMDVDKRFESLKSIKNHRQKELEVMAINFLKFSNITDKLDSVIQLAKFMGYEPTKKIKKSDDFIDFYMPENQSFFSKIRLVDLNALQKRGYVLVHYFISDSPDRPFYLGSFMPYGNSYCESNASTESTLFSFYSQCIFLSDFVSCIDVERA